MLIVGGIVLTGILLLAAGIGIIVFAEAVNEEDK